MIMEPILMLVNSAPSSAHARRAWQTARTLHAQGHSMTVFLLQDGVLAGLEREKDARGLPPEIRCQVLGEDLQLRGFAPSDLGAHVQVADYATLVDLFGVHSRVMGAF